MALEKDGSLNAGGGHWKDEEQQQQQKMKRWRLKSLIEMRPCGVYPFVEGPVYFNFSDHYGDGLFLDVHRDYCCGLKDNNYGRPFFYDHRIPAVQPWTLDDVYRFSSQDHLINLFFTHNLL